MNREQIINITNAHYRKLKKKLKSIVSGFDSETIHQFRIEYKKLRAFLRMISRAYEPGKKIKFSKKLREAYKISGIIRNLQLQQKRILDTIGPGSKKPKAYINFLQKRISKLKFELQRILLKNPVTKSRKKTGLSIPDEFPLNKAGEFIREKEAAISQIIISENYSDKNIHEIRKDLKDLLYNLKMDEGDENDRFFMNIWMRRDEQRFNKMTDELGFFQDKCTAISLLSPSCLSTFNKSIQEQLSKIKISWLKDKSAMKKLLVNELKADFNQQ